MFDSLARFRLLLHSDTGGRVFLLYGVARSSVLGPLEDGVEERLVKCLLDGENIPGTGEEMGWVPWETMEMLSKEFACAGVLRPQDIKRIGELAGIKWFLEDVFPPYFASPRWLQKRTPEKIETIRKEKESKIRKCLTRWGY